jgi:hypothetical protein
MKMDYVVSDEIQGAYGIHSSHDLEASHHPSRLGLLSKHQWYIACMVCGAKMWNRPKDISSACEKSIDADSKIYNKCVKPK